MQSRGVWHLLIEERHARYCEPVQTGASPSCLPVPHLPNALFLDKSLVRIIYQRLRKKMDAGPVFECSNAGIHGNNFDANGNGIWRKQMTY